MGSPATGEENWRTLRLPASLSGRKPGCASTQTAARSPDSHRTATSLASGKFAHPFELRS